MKRWRGRWIIVVSAIHTLVAVAFFGQAYSGIIDRGVFNAVGKDPMSGLAVWFLLFGAMLFLFGLTVLEFEKSSTKPLPRNIGWSLLAFVAVGVTLMPASGFWLVIPPAISIIRSAGAASPVTSEI